MSELHEWKDYFYSWDDTKNEINKRKHGVDFKDAMTVFDDDDALYKPDPDHSNEEERFIIIGYSKQERLLVVCHCYRENDAIVRIFSARKATSEESKEYGGRI